MTALATAQPPARKRKRPRESTGKRAGNMSVEAFYAMPDNVGYELVNGKLEERQMGAKSSSIGMHIGRRFLNHIDEAGAPAEVCGSDLIVKIFADPRTGRRPDVAVILKSSLPGGELPETILTVPPELVVEVVSPNDLATKVADKPAIWHGGGVKIVWTVFPDIPEVIVSGGSQDGAVIRADGELRLPEVLPGFAMNVRDLLS